MQSPESGPVHYGGLVVSAAFALIFSYGIFNSFGVYFTPMAAEFGWSRAVVSFAFSFYAVSYSFSSAFIGRLADRYRVWAY